MTRSRRTRPGSANSRSNTRIDGARNLLAFARGALQFKWLRGSGHESHDPIIRPGDLVVVTLDLAAVNAEVGTRESVEVHLIPESATSTIANFQTPATFGGRTVITLR